MVSRSSHLKKNGSEWCTPNRTQCSVLLFYAPRSPSNSAQTSDKHDMNENSAKQVWISKLKISLTKECHDYTYHHHVWRACGFGYHSKSIHYNTSCLIVVWPASKNWGNDKFWWFQKLSPNIDAMFRYSSKCLITLDRGCSIITWTQRQIATITTKANRREILSQSNGEQVRTTWVYCLSK